MAAIILVRLYEGSGIRVEAYKAASWYNFRIFTLKNHMTSTKVHNEYGNETWWTEAIQKFETKTAANNYFKAIQRNNPDLRYVGIKNRQLQFGKVSYK